MNKVQILNGERVRGKTYLGFIAHDFLRCTKKTKTAAKGMESTAHATIPAIPPPLTIPYLFFFSFLLLFSPPAWSGLLRDPRCYTFSFVCPFLSEEKEGLEKSLFRPFVDLLPCLFPLRPTLRTPSHSPNCFIDSNE